MDRTETLGHFIMSRNYSEFFQKAYPIPLCASIWSCSSDKAMDYSAFSVLSYCRNHYLFQLYGCSQCLTVRGSPQNYANKLREELEGRGCQIRTNCKVYSLTANDTECTLVCCDGSKGAYDGCIVAVPAPEALRILGKKATYEETKILGAFQYIYSLVEDGGAVVTFEGCDKSCTWKTVLKVHNPQFYRKVTTEADFGFADSYIDGDFSFVDKEGLLNFFRIILANQYKLYPSTLMVDKRSLDIKGWCTPMLFTAGIASLKYYFYKHVCKRNSVKAARQNIASHYDLSNEMFSLFLDETMTYSCAIFKSENEDLKVAQLRKLHLLIDKARVKEHHQVLDIGCGWGSLAIEIVRKTGCRYTGITLAEEQLKLAEQRVKEAGLEDRIQFLLSDYCQLPTAWKFDRIISIGMVEHVGHDYYEDYFRVCESVLAENGLFVLQTISVPDELYDGFRRSSGFINEYIFPGGFLPSLNRMTSAMLSASRLCVEHVENIGVHYGQTLRCWRQNFLNNRSKIMSLGFDDKFIRAWEYYFDYTASAFNLRTIGDYQIVFSRLGNLVAFCDPYDSIPSSYCFP